MNVLLIDDDRFVVNALEKKIDWASLAVSGVFQAFDGAQARKIIEEDQIDICVCDIEMPGESGLELLAWVREEKYQIQFILLTSYAEFRYAKKAIELSSMDYQLKPVDFDQLYGILKKAVEKARETAKIEHAMEESRFLKSNQQNILDAFWKKMLTDPALAESAALAAELRKKALPYHCDDFFVPILFKMYPSIEQRKNMSEPMTDFSFCNIAAETLQESCILFDSLFPAGRGEYLLLIGGIRLLDVQERITLVLKTLLNNERAFFHMDISCCVSPEVIITGLFDAVSRLRAMREENLGNTNRPLFFTGTELRRVSYAPPPLDVLSGWLEQRRADKALEVLQQYLSGLTGQRKVNKEVLVRLRLDMEQLVFAFLHKNGIRANTLFCDERTEALHALSQESAEAMTDYLQHIIVRGIEYSTFVSEENSVMDIVLDYIHRNYADGITRNMLADLVHMNSDYMARVFKSHTGTSVINYIMKYRIEKAKEMLCGSKIPVGLVASQVGYGNYSYFSKLFRDAEGCTPNEYRRRNGEAKT